MKKFFLDTNLFWGNVKSIEELEKVKALCGAYSVDIFKAKASNEFKESNPKFGFGRAYHGELTLSEWLEK